MNEDREPLDNYFGNCPFCGDGTAVVNIGRDHFGYCLKHETCWYIGSNLLSNWEEESQEDWDSNEEFLKGMAYVRPIHYKDEITPLAENGRVKITNMKAKILLERIKRTLSNYQEKVNKMTKEEKQGEIKKWRKNND